MLGYQATSLLLFSTPPTSTYTSKSQISLIVQSPTSGPDQAAPTAPTSRSSTALRFGTTSPVSSTRASNSPETSSSGQSTQTTGGSSTEYIDDYGNPFNITYGTLYQGRVVVRAVRPGIASCLTLCDEIDDCAAVNYVGGECQVLTDVTGATSAPNSNEAGAARPRDHTTRIHLPPSTYNGGATASGALSGTRTRTRSVHGSNSEGGMTYSPIVTSARASQSTYLFPSRTVSRRSHSMARGPGPVSASNSRIVSGGSSLTGKMSPSASSLLTPGSLCPTYDSQQYTDRQGENYRIHCNASYSGTIIFSSNSTPTVRHKRHPGHFTSKTCLAYCDQVEECEAINYSCDGTCTLLADLEHLVTTGVCGFAARRISGSSSPGEGGGNSGGGSGQASARVNVITVSVCAATRTKIVLTTTTIFIGSSGTSAAHRQSRPGEIYF